MVQSLPGFLDLCLNVCSPCQVLRDVYTEVLEATHPLHRGPTDHKRSVGPLLSLPEGSLHWLPVCFRVDLKMLLLVYKSRNGLAPTYLCELLTEYQPIRSLDLLSTPKSRIKCRGDRAFSIAAPSLCNAWPLSIRQASSVNIFRSRLKTFLFSKLYG